MFRQRGVEKTQRQIELRAGCGVPLDCAHTPDGPRIGAVANSASNGPDKQGFSSSRPSSSIETGSPLVWTCLSLGPRSPSSILSIVQSGMSWKEGASSPQQIPLERLLTAVPYGSGPIFASGIPRAHRLLLVDVRSK